MRTLEYSCVLMGSSPVTMIEALHRRRTHERVLIIEESDRLGGAWGTRSVLGFDGVEIGPHVIYSSSRNRRVYRFLSDLLSVSMHPMRPEPIHRLSGRLLGIERVPLRHGWLGVASSVADEMSAMPRSPGEARRLGLAPRIGSSLAQLLKSLSGYNVEPRYPAGGSSEMVDRLAAMLADHGVDTITGARVRHCAVNRAEGNAVLDAGDRRFDCRKVIMTTHSFAPSISADGQVLDMATEDTEDIILFLLVEDASPGSFSYVRFGDHAMLVRISDVTPYARRRTAPSGRKIICAHLRSEFGCRPDTQNRLFDYLKEQGYIGAASLLVDHRYDNYRSKSMSEPLAAHIGSRCAPVVEVVMTGDNLSRAIGQNLSRWRGLAGPRAARALQPSGSVALARHS